jgi:hypothetical protein
MAISRYRTPATLAALHCDSLMVVIAFRPEPTKPQRRAEHDGIEYGRALDTYRRRLQVWLDRQRAQLRDITPPDAVLLVLDPVDAP